MSLKLKPGGGSHMQLYDSNNGEYTTEEKTRMRREDDFAIWSFEWNGKESEYYFHFPVEGIHDEEYCNKFLNCISNDIKKPIYIENKMKYLLKARSENDKSKFLKELGYSEGNEKELFQDICLGTDFTTLQYCKFAAGCFIVNAKTNLNGKFVTTGWRLEKSLDIFFVTLIPKGDKLWKKKKLN